MSTHRDENLELEETPEEWEHWRELEDRYGNKNDKESKP